MEIIFCFFLFVHQKLQKKGLALYLIKEIKNLYKGKIQYCNSTWSQRNYFSKKLDVNIILNNNRILDIDGTWSVLSKFKLCYFE